MKSKTIWIIILVLLIIVSVTFNLYLFKFHFPKENIQIQKLNLTEDIHDQFIKLRVGENYTYITLKEIKQDSVVTHIYKGSVECGTIDKDFEVTHEGIKIQGQDIYLEKIEGDLVTFRIRYTPTFC